MRLKIAALAVLAGTVLATSAAAQDFSRSGPYLAAGSLVAIETFDVGDFETGGGLDVRLGYRLTPHLSFDLLYQYAAMNGSVSGMDVDVSTWLFAMGPKLHLLTGRIQPYLAAGIGIQHMRFELPNGRVEDDDSLARVAGGIDLYVNEHWVVDAEFGYVLPLEELEDFDLVTFTLGLQYRF